MKTLKQILFTAVLTVGMFGFSHAQAALEKEVTIERLGFTVDSIDDLKTIDWDDLFTVFDGQDSDSKIALFVRLKDVDVIAKDSTEMSFSDVKYEVSGYVHEKDILKQRLQGVTDRLTSKYQDN